jgi:hypothetical protein
LATKDSIFFTREYYQTFFQEVDTINAVALGWVFPKEIDSINAKKINIVQQPFGSGDFILSTFPEAFTNYFILKENNREYTGNLFSYLDHGQTLLIDNHYKTGKSFHTSPMYIFLNTKELKWAYYMALIGALVYVLFEGKRKQRAIPVKVPLKNQTLAFTRTIANMYFESGQTHTIAQHCIENFKDYIRTHHYVPTNHVDDAFFQAVALRTQHEKEEVESLFNYFDQLEKKPQLSNEQIKILNQKIEAFKKRAYGKSRT